MLDFNQIKTFYPNSLHKFERGLLREYLQYQILSLVFNHKIGQKLSFLGGTNLRIVHGLQRFSEDIDFDHKGLEFGEFEKLGEHIKRELELRGYQVENTYINRSAFHCYIKFPHLLFQQGISPLEEEKILIQLDTFDQGVEYPPEIFILNQFEFFDQIRVTPKETILSQKLWTITQRKRLKGRDFYDALFLLQNTKPDIQFLEAKFGTRDLNTIVDYILTQLATINYRTLADDVRPFLLSSAEADKISIFPTFLRQQLQ